MELDDLKDMWKQTPVTKKNNDIMEILQHKTYGPVAALKHTYRRQMMLMFIIPLMLFVVNARHTDHILSSILFWSYVAFCICMILFAWYNYRIVRKMEIMDGQVRTNLEQQITLLEKRASLEVNVLRGILIFFIILLEVVPYLQHYSMLNKWHALSPAIRFGAYAGFLILQYFLNKKVRQRKVGRHLAYLKTLVSEMQ
jgi:hypothetical protein